MHFQLALFTSLCFFVAGVNAQSPHDVRQLTNGDCDDDQPALTRNDRDFLRSGPEWMAFRRTDTSSQRIAVRRIFLEEWTRDDPVIDLQSPIPDIEVRHPAIASGSDWASRSAAVVVWEGRRKTAWNLRASFNCGDSAIWSAPKALTGDFTDNTNPRVCWMRDSTFVLAWVRGQSVLYSFLTPSTMTSPAEAAVSRADTLTMDMNGSFVHISFAWTDVDSGGKGVICCRAIDADPPGTLSDVDTISGAYEARNPRLVIGGYTQTQVTYEAVLRGHTDVFITDGYYTKNVSLDTLSDNINPSASIPIRMTNVEPAFRLQVMWDEVPMTFEKWGSEVQKLIFCDEDTLSNVLPQYDRDAALGASSIYQTNYSATQVVWEGKRTDHSRIYGRTLFRPTGSVEDEALVPGTYRLHQNFPNPFNPATRIRFELQRQGFVTLTVYDLLGRQVTRLFSERMNPGPREVVWDARAYPSGTYFCVLSVNGRTEVRRMLLLK